MNISDIINFLKTTLLGLFILGVVTSVIASIIYDIFKKQWIRIAKFVNYKFRLSQLKKLARYVFTGYSAGQAHKSSFHQILLIGDFIIDIIIQVGRCLFLLLIFIALLVLVPQPYFWLLVVLFSALITIQYSKLRDYRKRYKAMFDLVYGKDFDEKQLKALETILHKQPQKESDAVKEEKGSS